MVVGALPTSKMIFLHFLLWSFEVLGMLQLCLFFAQNLKPSGQNMQKNHFWGKNCSYNHNHFTTKFMKYALAQKIFCDHFPRSLRVYTFRSNYTFFEEKHYFFQFLAHNVTGKSPRFFFLQLSIRYIYFRKTK